MTAIVLNVVGATSLIYDDRTYHDMAVAMAAHRTSTWGPFTTSLYHSTATLLVPLTWLYRIFGPHELVGRTFVAAIASTTAVLGTILAGRLVQPKLALAVGLVLALLPSQVLFSAVTLKDGIVWPLLLLIAVLVATASDVQPPRRVVLLSAGSAIPLFLLAYLRHYTLVVAAIALATAPWFGPRRDRILRCGTCVVVAIAIPLAIGMGPLGFGALPTQESLSHYRMGQSTGGSAIDRGTTTVPRAGDHHGVGSVPNGEDSSPTLRNIRHLPEGLVAAALRPFPWEAAASRKASTARIEDVFWYMILALAAVGIRPTIRRRRVTAFPALLTIGLVSTYALAEGNVGTAFRHRGEIVWAMVILASLGAERLLGKHAVNGSDAIPVAAQVPAQE